MDKEKQILSAFAEELRRHNSVKRRTNLIGHIMAWGWVLLFVILAVYAFVYPAMQNPKALMKTYQLENP